MGIKVKQIDDIQITGIKNNDILVYSESSSSFVNGATLSKAYSAETIPVRDSRGNVKVGSALDDEDAISLEFLKTSKYIKQSDMLGMFSSNTINYTISDDTIQSEVKLPSDYSILMSYDGKITSTSYLKEVHSENPSCAILVSGKHNTSSYHIPVNSAAVLIDSAKYNYTDELAIVTTSNNINIGAQITTYSYYNSNRSDTPSYLEPISGQRIFGVTAYGGSTKAFESYVAKGQSEYNAFIQLNGSEILHTSNKNIFLSSGLCVSNTSDELNGMIRFNGAHFEGYENGSWVLLDSNATDSYITYDIVSTVNVGNIEVGDTISQNSTITDFVKQLVRPKYDIMLNDFEVEFDGQYSLPVDGYAEYGATLIVESVSFNPQYYIEQQLGNVKVSGNGFLGSYTEYINDTVVSDDSSTATFTVDDPEYEWTIEGTFDQSQTSITENSYTIKSVYATYFGALNESEISSGLINNLQNKFLTDDINLKITCDMNNQNSSYYTYIAYPYNEYGSINHIHLCGMNVTDAFEDPVTIDHTNSYGYTHQYVVYKSRVPGAFSSGNILILK